MAEIGNCSCILQAKNYRRTYPGRIILMKAVILVFVLLLQIRFRNLILNFFPERTSIFAFHLYSWRPFMQGMTLKLSKEYQRGNVQWVESESGMRQRSRSRPVSWPQSVSWRWNAWSSQRPSRRKSPISPSTPPRPRRTRSASGRSATPASPLPRPGAESSATTTIMEGRGGPGGSTVSSKAGSNPAARVKRQEKVSPENRSGEARSL